MKSSIYFHRMDISESVKKIVELKSSKFEKLFGGQFELKWTLSKEGKTYHTHTVLISPHKTMNADSKSEDIYKSIEETSKKLLSQLTKYKESTRNPIHANSKIQDYDPLT